MKSAYLELLKLAQGELATRRALGVLLTGARGQMGLRGGGTMSLLGGYLKNSWKCECKMMACWEGIWIWKEVLIVMCKIGW